KQNKKSWPDLARARMASTTRSTRSLDGIRQQDLLASHDDSDSPALHAPAIDSIPPSMTPITVVHVVECLDLGGASRAALANAASWRKAHGGRAVFVSLAPPSLQMAERARAQGLEVVAARDR